MNSTTIRADTSQRHRQKYANKNPLHRMALGRFHDAIAEEIGTLSPQSMLDFGCGEGFLVKKRADRGVNLPGYDSIDLRSDAVEFARERNPDQEFRTVDLLDLQLGDASCDVVVDSDVLEHLEDLGHHLQRLAALSSRSLLLTVPHEPWLRLLNLMRGRRDTARLGNHPEHVQHQNPRSFARLVESYVNVTAVRSVFPFIFATAHRE